MRVVDCHIDEFGKTIQALREKIVVFEKDLIIIKKTKQERTECEKANSKMQKSMDKLHISHENVKNEQNSLENLVEKYMPLRMLNLICEATEESFSAKAAKKLREVVGKIGEELRVTVMKDIGNPVLKQVCLNLITKLRLETAMLNETKTGPATLSKNNLRAEQPVSEFKPPEDLKNYNKDKQFESSIEEAKVDMMNTRRKKKHADLVAAAIPPPPASKKGKRVFTPEKN